MVAIESSASPNDPKASTSTDDGPLCTCDHGQNRHYVDTTYGAPGPIRGCYDCPTGSHLHQFVPAGGAR